MTASRTTRRATPAHRAPSPTAVGGVAAVLRLVVVGLLVVVVVVGLVVLPQ